MLSMSENCLTEDTGLAVTYGSGMDGISEFNSQQTVKPATDQLGFMFSMH